MNKNQHIITIVGGSGFLGRYVVRHLAKAGYRIRVICRRPQLELELKTAGDPGQIALSSGNLAHPESLTGQLAGSFAVINLVGVLFESGHQNFETLHAKGAEELAKMARAAGVRRFIQISALGIDKAIGSHYARTKLQGEKAVSSAFPGATILRPSVMFGPEDDFFNQFAAMPIQPLIGGGATKFQPVYVDDVAKAILACLMKPETKGQLYELAGPKTYSFKELLHFTNHTLRKDKPRLMLSYGVASFIAFLNEMAFKLIPILRKPVLTRDQLRLLKVDNVASQGAKGFGELGITPECPSSIVPAYLARFNPKKVQ